MLSLVGGVGDGHDDRISVVGGDDDGSLCIGIAGNRTGRKRSYRPTLDLGSHAGPDSILAAWEFGPQETRVARMNVVLPGIDRPCVCKGTTDFFFAHDSASAGGEQNGAKRQQHPHGVWVC